MLAEGYTPQALLTRTREAIRARGPRPVIGDLTRWAGRLAGGAPWSLAGHHGSFAFRGDRHAYLYHRYKRSWLTERAVEVPVVQAIVDRHARTPGARILEVGHVLGHYRRQSHLVIDKYEIAPGVLNRDVLEIDDLGAFDLIVAISTLEHVGYDERPRDPDGPRRAAHALRERLAPGGLLVITVPVGYNPAFDAALRSGAIATTDIAALRRVGGRTRWREIDPADVWSAPYDFLLYSAHGVLFAFIERERGSGARARG
jgi:SAM-dependent methyltransferase